MQNQSSYFERLYTSLLALQITDGSMKRMMLGLFVCVFKAPVRDHSGTLSAIRNFVSLRAWMYWETIRPPETTLGSLDSSLSSIPSLCFLGHTFELHSFYGKVVIIIVPPPPFLLKPILDTTYQIFWKKLSTLTFLIETAAHLIAYPEE